MPARILLLLLLFPTCLYAQTPQVPARMEFAGIKLRITDEARKEIQKDVDALTKSPKYFNIKVERARTYFPLIEKVFREEGLHDDFKYLVLQESALIPDAVSSSNAVGFWQFKDFTAMEVGLRVDNHIDERMNIISSSRGAARYMKKNNKYFDNWLHTLQAYQMGPGGALRALEDDKRGATSMVIDRNTYWYVKKFLAHKIAFEKAVDGPGATRLEEYSDGANKSLKDISKQTGIAVQQLQDYNRWLLKGKIPDDRNYTVVLPVSKLDKLNLASVEGERERDTVQVKEREAEITYRFPTSRFPLIEDYEEAKKGAVVRINKLPAVIGQEGDVVALLARRIGIDLSDFLEYNEIEINDSIVPGQVYYLKRKRRKAQAHFYVARPGETYWSVAQKFGIRLKKLKGKNRVRGSEELEAGRVLWLRFIRPEHIAVEYRKIPDGQKEKTPEDNTVNPVLAVEIDSVGEGASSEAAVKVSKISQPDVIEASGQDPGSLNSEVDSSSIKNDEYEVEEAYTEAEAENFEASINKDMNVEVVHQVKPGETLYSISKKYNVEVREILEWNSLSISDGLQIDQKLIILEGITSAKKLEPVISQDEYTYHTVADGDTLYKIARSYDVTIEDLMTWNDKKDFSISPGEKIRIRKDNQ